MTPEEEQYEQDRQAQQQYWHKYYGGQPSVPAPGVKAGGPPESSATAPELRTPVLDEEGKPVDQWFLGTGRADPTMRNISIGADRFVNALAVPFANIAQSGKSALHSLAPNMVADPTGDWGKDWMNYATFPQLTPQTPSERIIAAGATEAGGNVPLSVLTRSLTPMIAGGAFGAGAQAAREYGGPIGQKAAPIIEGVGGVISAWPVGNIFNRAAARAAGVSEAEYVRRLWRGDQGEAWGNVAGSLIEAGAGAQWGSPRSIAAGLGAAVRIVAGSGHAIGGALRSIIDPRTYLRAGTAYWGTVPQMQTEGQWNLPPARPEAALQ
jgi:hypothetical protein